MTNNKKYFELKTVSRTNVAADKKTETTEVNGLITVHGYTGSVKGKDLIDKGKVSFHFPLLADLAGLNKADKETLLDLAKDKIISLGQNKARVWDLEGKKAKADRLAEDKRQAAMTPEDLAEYNRLMSLYPKK
jgi:hypothetical protein